MKQKTRDIIWTLLGLLLLVSGFVLKKAFPEAQGLLLTLPYVCIGVGCGAFGHGMGNCLSRGAVKNSPELQKQMEVEQNDERNVAIANRAKAKAYDMMVFVFGALMLSFALMQIQLAATLLLVFAYLLVIGYGVYCRCKYEKEM